VLYKLSQKKKLQTEMITFKVVQNQSQAIESSYLKWYARPVVEETMNTEDLAEHMSRHNSPYSKGVLIGILTDMVACIKEQLLEGKNVRIDNLAIFSVGIASKKGADTKEEFTISGNISGVRLRARSTGELSYSQLNLDATLKRSSLDKSATPDDGDDDDDDNEGIIIDPDTDLSDTEDDRKDIPGEDGMI
jgi:predicted histone-like DNA-binding protein